jgi:peptidase E
MGRLMRRSLLVHGLKPLSAKLGYRLSMSSIRGKIVLMGSGELTATMVEVHKSLLAQLPGNRQAAFIDTPAGFQLNVDQISQKAAAYFHRHVQHPLTIASYKSHAHITDFDAEQAFHTLRESDYILIGPGSPTYAVRQWRESPIPEILTRCVIKGGTLVAASAAALTVGSHTLPVYEIYKVGHDLQWETGMDILAHFGFNLVVVPHWNNAEGGTHDTRCCFMGETRFRRLEALLPDKVSILGIDEHTACMIDFARNLVEVKGLGRVTLRNPKGEAVFDSGDRFACDVLRGAAAASNWKAETAPSPSPPGPSDRKNETFWEKIHSLEADFQEGLQQHDSRRATNALLEFDRTIWQAQADLENEEFVAQARDTLRDLIVLFGTELDAAPRDATEWLSPLVDALLELRRKFRINRQWDEADAIRDALQQVNIIVEDDKEGSSWRLEN